MEIPVWIILLFYIDAKSADLDIFIKEFIEMTFDLEQIDVHI